MSVTLALIALYLVCGVAVWFRVLRAEARGWATDGESPDLADKASIGFLFCALVLTWPLFAVLAIVGIAVDR